MQSISVFLDLANVAELRLKNADVSKNQGVCHVFGSSLGKA